MMAMKSSEAQETLDDDDDDAEAHLKLEDQREYVACLKCTNDCYLSPHSAAFHGPSQLPSAPSFMAVVDDTALSHLEIPRSFADACLGRCTGEARIEGPSGWVWYAPFMHGDNHSTLALGSPGWDDFAHDHVLERGDLLVLTYFGTLQLFRVRVFNAAEGVEKSPHCLPSKPHYASTRHHVHQTPPSQGMELQIYDNKRKSLISQTNELTSDITARELDGIDGHKHQFEQSKSKQKSTKSSCNCKDADKNDIVYYQRNNSSHNSENCAIMNCCNCHGNCYQGSNGGRGEPKNQLIVSKSKARGHKHNVQKPTQITGTKPISTSKHENQDGDAADESKALVPYKRGPDQLFDQKQLVPTRQREPSLKLLKYVRTLKYNPYAIASPAERERVNRKANAFRSAYPFTIKSIPASSIYKDRKLMFPKAFVDAHMPRMEAWMTWEDEEGKQWRVMWLPQRKYNKRISIISAGWAGFCNEHHLIEHDICIFEMINRKALHFHVHIFKQEPLDGTLPL